MKKESNFQLKFGKVIIAVILLIIIISIFYVPYDINLINGDEKLLSPSIHHILGTDNLGRDVFSRVIAGTRFTFIVSVLTVLFSSVVGTVLGMFSGYSHYIVDEIIMRIIDAISSFPGILLALVLVSVMNKQKYTIILALSVIFIPSFTRISRNETLKCRNEEYIRSAQVFGASKLRILFVHMLPNIMTALMPSIIIGLSKSILAESSMSYLGLGIQPPYPSWGRMLFESQPYLFYAPWCALSPGLMIMITVIGFNYIGDGLSQKYVYNME